MAMEHGRTRSRAPSRRTGPGDRPRLLALIAILASGVVAACDAGGRGVAEQPEASLASAATIGGVAGDTPFIVVDQFGYRPDMTKIAIIRDPAIGFDAADQFAPGATLELVNEVTGDTVYAAPPASWRDGAVDEKSGDRVWSFDFSSVDTPGTYVVRDQASGRTSPSFVIGDDVYNQVLKTALRTFYYQRAGFAKEQRFAGPWRDGASHVGPGQDTQARRYDAPDDASSERDLHGGWYDAGDYNRYSNWTSDYIIDLLASYSNKPSIWTDDVGIPESGNGRADILDEVKYGLDWLMRMQNDDGSVLSVLGVANGSPPSTAEGPSAYGPENTSATLSAASAFAFAALVYGSLNDTEGSVYAEELRARAEKAWVWANANPNVVFRNNDDEFGSRGLAAGQQEVDDAGRLKKKIIAAIFLAELTDAPAYHDYVARSYGQTKMIDKGYADVYESPMVRALLRYAAIPSADAAIKDAVRDQYAQIMEFSHLWGAVDKVRDPYRSPVMSYHWGSNSLKARQALLFLRQADHDVGSRPKADAYRTAAGYLHYLHGVNPLGLVYLSNMERDGAERSVDTFYHSWFRDGSDPFDSVSQSTFGPPPGFLVGGPNPNYTWDRCCPDSCGSRFRRRQCGAEAPSPPAGQPPTKSYRQFNDGWPLNSWEVTENANGYQTAYIELLSKFVD